MPTYRQLEMFGTIAPIVLPSSGVVHKMPAGCCDCGERVVILTTNAWTGLGKVGNAWGCLDCNNYCDAGDHLTDVDDVYICHQCDACSDCCDCPFCEGCSETVSERDMQCCGRCSDCCDCYVCVRCPTGQDHVSTEDWFCGDCERCESCCECVRCSYCGELTDVTCEDHYYCSYCCDGCGIDSPDDTDMEGIRHAVADVPAYVPLEASRIGPYTFGVELEHNGNGVSAAREVMRCVGLDAWQSKEDGSLHASTGAEVVSPILRGEDGFAQMRTAMLALAANGGNVNRECGTHVHIGADDMEADDIARLVRFYHRNVSLIDSFHPRSRRNAYYAENMTTGEVERVTDYAKEGDKRHTATGQFGRYRKVNLHSLRSHGTIEFRQHAGTLNPRKLEAWIRLLFALCDCARFSAAEETFFFVADLLDHLRGFGLDEPSIAYLMKRSADLATT